MSVRDKLNKIDFLPAAVVVGGVAATVISAWRDRRRNRNATPPPRVEEFDQYGRRYRTPGDYAMLDEAQARRAAWERANPEEAAEHMRRQEARIAEHGAQAEERQRELRRQPPKVSLLCGCSCLPCRGGRHCGNRGLGGGTACELPRSTTL